MGLDLYIYIHPFFQQMICPASLCLTSNPIWHLSKRSSRALRRWWESCLDTRMLQPKSHLIAWTPIFQIVMCRLLHPRPFHGSTSYMLYNIYNNQSKRFCLDLPSHVMRLHDSLEQLDVKMRESYEKFAKYLTDLKLEHRDGSVSSTELDELLDLPINIFYEA